MAKFDQHTSQTGWSPADHRQCFYDGLNDCIKDTLSYTDLPIGTFEELRNAASKLDKCMRQREAEKRGTTSQSTNTNTPQKDPNAMDIDTSRQNQQSSTGGEQRNRQTYLKWMTGKCFGCGSKDHSKKDGDHIRDICNHCRKTGHRGPVCFSKYMKKPPAKAALLPQNPCHPPQPQQPLPPQALWPKIASNKQTCWPSSWREFKIKRSRSLLSNHLFRSGISVSCV